MFEDRVTSCRLQQLFRGAVLRVVFGLCLSVGLVLSLWCSPDVTARLLRRWLAVGLGVNWGIGLPHFLAVVGSGVKLLQDGFAFEVRVKVAASRRRMMGLLGTSVALTLWQCLWWVRGAQLLFRASRSNNHVFYWFCVLCAALWPMALISMQFLDRWEQSVAMKGAAARMLLMPASSSRRCSSGDSDCDSNDDGSSTISTQAPLSCDMSYRSRRVSDVSDFSSMPELGCSLSRISEMGSSFQSSTNGSLSPSARDSSWNFSTSERTSTRTAMPKQSVVKFAQSV